MGQRDWQVEAMVTVAVPLFDHLGDGVNPSVSSFH